MERSIRVVEEVVVVNVEFELEVGSDNEGEDEVNEFYVCVFVVY